MASRFEGRKVLLTGGLGSLGRSQAAAFIAEGADLLLLDRPGHDGATSVLEDIGCAGSGTVRLIEQDLAQLEATRAAIEATADEVGGIDVLVNNAALIVNKPFEEFSISEYEEQMRVNAGAAFALIQSVASGMKRKGGGAIVNFCSVTLSGAWEGYAPYVASKGAMLGLTRGLARELGKHGIRVNAISPGAVVSEAEQRVFGARAAEYRAWVLSRQCLARDIQPEDIASAVLFLASDEARMISGHLLEVDGGW